MIKKLLLAFGLSLFLPVAAFAQSTAAQVIDGYLTTVGCPSGATVCFVQYGQQTTATPLAGNVLDGYQTFTATTAATTLITVPQGRTWTGEISANVSCQEVAAGTAACQARAVFTTAGTNVTPAAGTYFACEAKNGANAATGLVGDGTSNYCYTPLVVVAPGANSVTVQVTTTNAGTASVVDATAVGSLQ